MKRSFTYVWLSILVFAVCIACIFAPSYLLKSKDSAIVGQISRKEMASAGNTLDNKLTILEKIDLLLNRDTNLMDLTQGKLYNKETVLEVFHQQIERLKELGIIPGQEYAFTSYDLSAYYLISMDNPTESLIIWELFLNTDDYSAYFTLEEESGLIMMFNLSFPYNNPFAVSSSAGSSMWAEYLGVALRQREMVEDGASKALEESLDEQFNSREIFYYTQGDKTIPFYIFLSRGQYTISPS